MACPNCHEIDHQHYHPRYAETESTPAEAECMECCYCGEIYEPDHGAAEDAAYEDYKHSEYGLAQ